MKKLFILAVMAIISSAAFAQLGYTYTKSQSDARYYTKTSADTTFVNVADLVKPISFDTVQVTNKATAPTKMPSTYTNDIATTEFVHSLEKSDLLRALQAMGSNVKSIPAAATNIWYGSQAMTDGRAWQATHIIADTITVTGVAYAMQTQGNYNADNYNGFYLCSVSGANLTVIAQTADDGTIWKKVAAVYSTKAFTSPVVLPPGVYTIFGVWNTSDASPAVVPIFYSAQGGGVSTIYNSMIANGHKFEGYINGVTSVPVAPFASSSITGIGVSPTFLLY